MSEYDQKRKIAMLCWKRGTEAMNSQNWDYAIEMFCQAAMQEPENLLYRQTLRGCERKKYGNPNGISRFSGAKLMTIRGRVKKSRMGNNWADLDSAAEEGLKVNPWDAQLNADMAEACDQRGFADCAIFGYTAALETEAENKGWLRSLAVLLTQKGEYSRARTCWEKVYKLDPTDSEARSMMTQVDAKQVMDRGGYEDAGTTRDVKKGQAYNEADGRDKARQQASDGPGMSVEADLQRAIRKNPADVNNYTKLAMHYQKEKKLPEAVEMYAKALQVVPDSNIREQMEDCELDLLRMNLAKAKELANAGGADDTHKKNASALAGELLKQEIEVLSRRVERYPQNLQVKFELGRRFMRAKKYPLAIPLLQSATADNRLQAEALLNLGKCFVQDNKRQLGLRNLEKVIPLVSQHEGKELFCEAHYLLGCLYQEAKNLPKAEEHFTEVLGVDYSYKDTVKRLDEIQGGSSGGGDESAA